MPFYHRDKDTARDVIKAAVRQGHEADLRAVLAELNRQLDVTWGLLDLENLDATRTAWLRQSVDVVASHQASAADVAARFCQDLSTAELGSPMSVVRPHLGAANLDEVTTALDALGPAGIKTRIGQGVAPQAAADQARQAVLAAAQQRVSAADRSTVMDSTRADPRYQGWRRITHGGCKFCNMLAGRGEVYSADSVRFASHDHCRCTAEPATGGTPVNVNQYTASKEKITETERQRLKDYLAGMDDDGVTPKGSDAAPPEPSTGAGKPPRKTAARATDDDHTHARHPVGVPEGLRVHDHEMDTARLLADEGHEVTFLPIDNTPGTKNPDVLVDGHVWEMKSPLGSSERNTIADQFKRAGRQADRLVLDLRRCGLDDEVSLRQAERRFMGQSRITGVIVIDHDGRTHHLGRAG